MEIAIADAILFLGDVANVISPTGFNASVVKSVNLLLEELFNEGGGHSELVGEKIAKVFDAALNLQNVLKVRPTDDQTRNILKGNDELVQALKTALSGATSASIQASQATKNALQAAEQAASAVQAAVLKGAIDVATAALESAKAAAKAARAAAVSAVEAQKAAISLTKHVDDYGLATLATQASVAAALASENSAKALAVFDTAHEAVNKARKAT